ncbi:hypothetical protein GGX14DRAFT_393416 [Mycena pura]|uniref:Uncharacterized protein n=1 Tax=Mycena pura TaxID=153505 RepID=A0AAD6VK86_9AGAR|nr:hypothetical protein GGX14DRAFT_393416 [Mycena pura]
MHPTSSTHTTSTRIAIVHALRLFWNAKSDLPLTEEDGSPRAQARNVLLAVIRPVKLAKKNPFNTPYYQDGQFLPLEVIDVDDISYLVARISDPGSGPRLWALCERPDAMGMAERSE